MKAFALGAILAGASAVERPLGGQVSIKWTDCGAPHGHTDSISPSTITLGQPAQVEGKGSIDEDINGGSFEFTVSVPVIGKIIDHKGDICKAETIDLPLGIGSLAWKGLPCPVKAGPVDLAMGLTLSEKVPASLAQATINLQASATNGDKVLCLTLQTAPAWVEQVPVLAASVMPALPVAMPLVPQMLPALALENPLGGQVSISWTDCGAAHGHTDSISPTTITLGQTTQVEGKGSVDEDVSGGGYEFTVSVPILGKVLDHKGDICKSETITLPLNLGTMDLKGLPCPVKAGPVDLTMGLTLSDKVPASLAKATISLQASATNGDKILCLTMQTAPLVTVPMNFII